MALLKGPRRLRFLVSKVPPEGIADQGSGGWHGRTVGRTTRVRRSSRLRSVTSAARYAHPPCQDTHTLTLSLSLSLTHTHTHQCGQVRATPVPHPVPYTTPYTLHSATYTLHPEP